MFKICDGCNLSQILSFPLVDVIYLLWQFASPLNKMALWKMHWWLLSHFNIY